MSNDTDQDTVIDKLDTLISDFLDFAKKRWAHGSALVAALVAITVQDRAAEQDRSMQIDGEGYYLRGDPETAYFSMNRLSRDGKFRTYTFSPDGTVTPYTIDVIRNFNGAAIDVKEIPQKPISEHSERGLLLVPACTLAAQMEEAGSTPFLPKSGGEKRVRAEGQKFLNVYCPH